MQMCETFPSYWINIFNRLPLLQVNLVLMKVPCWHFWRVRSYCVKLVCHSSCANRAWHWGADESFVELFSLSLRLLAPCSAIQWWTPCRKKETLAWEAYEQIHDCHNIVYSLYALFSYKTPTIVTNTSSVMFLIHLSQGIDKPGWEHREFLGVWCCFLLTSLMFSPVFSSAGIEPSGCYAWERMGWIAYSRAPFILRYNKTSTETKGGFNWANCWCLRAL